MLRPDQGMTQFAIHTPKIRRPSSPRDRHYHRPAAAAAFSPSIFFESPGAALNPPVANPLESVHVCDGLLRSLLVRSGCCCCCCGASPNMADTSSVQSPDTNQQVDRSMAVPDREPADPANAVPALSLLPPDTDGGYQQGSSCHQCKSRRQLSELSFCNNVTKRRSPVIEARSPRDDVNERSHSCRKKYCDLCLKKFYGEKRDESGASWPCPSCRLICSCAACRRQKMKAKNIPERFLSSTSPATAVACSIVYFRQEIDELLFPDALKLAAPQPGRITASPVRAISFRTGVVQASVTEPSSLKRPTKKKIVSAKQKRVKLEPVGAGVYSTQDETEAESERVEKEATAEAAILLASLRTIVPNTISAS